ncbi:MAG: exodeoxyribonuclease VII small subunit [Tissierellia bacterium]|nr:exodeoxyribonuclease VII small subunit [Tissierellia bacterium]
MNLAYEEAILELEKILIELESENCTLKEALEKFKRGVELYNHCKDLITKAEGEIKIILEDDESMKEETFSMEV